VAAGGLDEIRARAGNAQLEDAFVSLMGGAADHDMDNSGAADHDKDNSGAANHDMDNSGAADHDKDNSGNGEAQS
jgi:hypothetical protein